MQSDFNSKLAKQIEAHAKASAKALAEQQAVFNKVAEDREKAAKKEMETMKVNREVIN